MRASASSASASSANARVPCRRGELDEPPRGTAGAPGREPRRQLTVLGEPPCQCADLLVPLCRARAQRLSLLVGGVLVVHGRVRRYEEDVSIARAGRRSRGEQRGGGTDGDGGPRQQRGVTERLARPGVRVRVGDDHAVDQLRPGGQHARVVDGVDGLCEVAPARQRGDPVLSEELDGGEHVRAGRQQAPVAERPEDPRVVGRGGPQVEQLTLGGGDTVVEQFTQFVGEVVQLLGGEGAFGGRPGLSVSPAHRPGLCRPADRACPVGPARSTGTPARAGRRRTPLLAAPVRGAEPIKPGLALIGAVTRAGTNTGRAGTALTVVADPIGHIARGTLRPGPGNRHSTAPPAGGPGQAQQLRQPLLPRQPLRGAPLGLVRPLGRRRRVRGAGSRQLGAGRHGSRLAGVLGGAPGGLPGGVPGRDGRLLGVARGERGPRRVGVGGTVVEPAGPHRFGGLLLDLAQALAQMPDLTSGALRGGGGSGRVRVSHLADVLEPGGPLLLLVGERLGAVGGAVQGPYEIDGGLGPRGERRRGVPLGLADRGGHARGAVGGGAVPQYGLGGLPRGVQGARVGQLTLLRGCGLLGSGERQRGVPVGEFGRDQRVRGAGALGLGDGVRGAGDPLGQLAGPAPLPHGSRGQAPGQCPRTPLGARVDVTCACPCPGGFDDPPEQVRGPGREVPLGDELGTPAELVAETADQVGEPVGVPGVGDRAQQQVGEVGVLLHGEETGGLALVGVHLPLVAEEFGVQAQVAEVFVPAVVDLLPVHFEVRVRLARLGDRVPEALHGAASPLRPGRAFHGRPYGGGLGDRQIVQAQPGPGPERVPGLGELPRVVGDLPPPPLAHLADDDTLTGQRVLPLQRHMPAVVGEQELAQHTGTRAAQRVPVARQHHREDQLEQHRLAAAVLQEEHARGRRATRRPDGLLLEELRLGGRGVGHRLTHSAQVEHGVGVARTGRPDGVEADPGQLVHGGGLS